LPLARYRARQDLFDLRADDLHFSLAETDALLNSVLGLDLADDALGPLHSHLEGWVAGLQLLSLTLRHRRATPTGLAVSGRHRFIADYLSEDVLANLPPAVRRFLLQTSVLDRLCASLCDAVTAGESGQAMLERLERENLFLVPLDDRREWFRYHRLFGDFLRAELERLQPDEVPTLHRRADGWAPGARSAGRGISPRSGWA
jgi:LuxR family maltose regulon positive regulatory protein